MDALQKALGYVFKDRSLMETALTHPSYAGEHRTPHYQRLEFLGDAVLELSISRILYFQLPGVDEGRLTRLRAELVREETLFVIAKKIGLGKFIRLSIGEDRTGGREKPSILSDITEALIAAVYLDGGFDAAFGLVSRLYEGMINANALKDTLDAKTRLQEITQKSGKMPAYELISSEGPPHSPTFVYRVTINGDILGEGSGRSKQAAQQEAARAALKKIGEKN